MTLPRFLQWRVHLEKNSLTPSLMLLLSLVPDWLAPPPPWARPSTSPSAPRTDWKAKERRVIRTQQWRRWRREDWVWAKKDEREEDEEKLKELPKLLLLEVDNSFLLQDFLGVELDDDIKGLEGCFFWDYLSHRRWSERFWRDKKTMVESSDEWWPKVLKLDNGYRIEKKACGKRVIEWNHLLAKSKGIADIKQ